MARLALVCLFFLPACGSLRQIDRAAKRTLAAVEKLAVTSERTVELTGATVQDIGSQGGKILLLVYTTLALTLYRYIGKFKLTDLSGPLRLLRDGVKRSWGWLMRRGGGKSSSV